MENLLLEDPVPAPKSRRPTNISGNMASEPRKYGIDAAANMKVPVVAVPVNTNAETEMNVDYFNWENPLSGRLHVICKILYVFESVSNVVLPRLLVASSVKIHR